MHVIKKWLETQTMYAEPRQRSYFIVQRQLALPHSWKYSTMGHVVEPLMERGQEGFRDVKRRSGLETEMIILVFFKNHPVTSFSCDLPLSGWWHAFKSQVLQFLLTAHMHTLSQVPFSEKEVLSHCPFYNRKCWSQDAQWTRVTFMGQDAHSNASWFSQQGCETQWHL